MGIKNHHVGPSKCSKGGHHCRVGSNIAPMGGLVGVGRRFDGESENIRIEDDASAHTPDAYAAHDFSLHFLRPSGSMNRVEECMGQEPGILRGRILARLRIRGMRRSSCWSPYCLLASSRDCTLTFGSGDVQHIRLDNLVESWYRSRILGHVDCVVSMPNREGGTAILQSAPEGRLQSMLGWPCVVLSWNLEDPRHVFPEYEDLEIHPSETHGSWIRFFINRRLYGLFVQEPGDWMDFRLGTRRLEELLSRDPETGWIFVLEPGGWMNFCPGTRRL
ncbi:LOW QUALITY PROTEIN: hypothetical protein HID58_079761 [Brassica napus]|uniref:Uncharacterized protein n=1 Tax=Brassica napus TaxID=3708 RepID=A0ABQ7Y302_BRANA|nr:LOW QUALITY PROTEIN: hypothetical protein HID58_079761 [Brassica napus]